MRPGSGRCTVWDTVRVRGSEQIADSARVTGAALTFRSAVLGASSPAVCCWTCLRRMCSFDHGHVGLKESLMAPHVDVCLSWLCIGLDKSSAGAVFDHEAA